MMTKVSTSNWHRNGYKRKRPKSNIQTGPVYGGQVNERKRATSRLNVIKVSIT